MNRVKNILLEQKKQSKLKKEIVKIKKTTPIYIVSIIFIMILLISLLEDQSHRYFGGTIYFVSAGVLITLSISFLFFFREKRRVLKKEKEVKQIGSKLYKLMKLESTE